MSSTVKKTAFVVVGPHRSGTSAMARVLSIYGASLPSDLMAPQADNPVGFWEPQSIVNFNDEVLADLDTSWEDPLIAPMQRASRNYIEERVDQASALLETSFEGASTIVLKDPRVSVVLPIWDKALQQSDYTPYYIFMVRNPLQVAASLNSRNRFVRQRGHLLWASYMLQGEQGTRNKRRIFVNYASLLDDPSRVIGRVEDFSGSSLPRNTNYAAIETERFLDQQLQHHRQTHADLAGNKSLWSPLNGIFKWFDEASRGDEPPFEGLDGARAKLAEIEGAAGTILAEQRMAAARIESQLSHSRDMADVLREELDTARSSVEVLRIDLQQFRERCSDAEAKAARLRDELRQAADLRTTWEAEREGLTSQLAVARSELAVAQNAAEGQKAALLRARNELASSQEQMQISAALVDELRVKLSLAAEQESLSRLDREALLSELAETQISHIRQHDLAVRLQGELTKTLEDQESGRSTLALMRSELEASHEKNQDARAQIESLGTKLRDADVLNESLRKSYDEIRVAFETVATERDTAVEKLEAMVSSAEGLKSEIATQRLIVGRMRDESELATSLSELAQAEISELRRTLGDTRAERDSSQKRLRENDLNQQQARASIQALQSEIDQQSRRIAALTEDATIRERHAANLEQQVVALRQSSSWRATAPLRTIGRLFRPRAPSQP